MARAVPCTMRSRLPGKTLASDRTASWQSLTVRESGGYAGLNRGTTVHRGGLDDQQAAALGALLRSIGTKYAKGKTPAKAAPAPDGQTLTLQLKTAAGVWDLSFDTADLPVEVAELMKHLPPLRPLPWL